MSHTGKTDEYYHNAKNRDEIYASKEGDHVIGEHHPTHRLPINLISDASKKSGIALVCLFMGFLALYILTKDYLSHLFYDNK